MMAFFHACGTKPASQALVISWCSQPNRLSPPCFHTSAGIPSPPGTSPYFRLTIALAISSMVGNLSRHVLLMRCGMLSRASLSMLSGTLSRFLPQFSCCQIMHAFHLLISGENIPFSWVPTLPSVRCRSPSCCFRQQFCSSTDFLSHQEITTLTC